MARPIDYSKWDNLDSGSDDDDNAPPAASSRAGAAPSAASGRAAATATAAAAALPADAAPLFHPEQLATVEEFEISRPERLKAQMDEALRALGRDLPGGPRHAPAAARAALLQSSACAALATVRDSACACAHARIMAPQHTLTRAAARLRPHRWSRRRMRAFATTRAAAPSRRCRSASATSPCMPIC
jgi:hypothetical protein